MAALTPGIRLFIVKALACYDLPKQIIEDVKNKFGVVVSPAQVSLYDPKNKSSKELSKDLRMAFATQRAWFEQAAHEIPIAKQVYRVNQLHKLYEKTASAGNVVVAAQLLEQAAKETGGSFTNRREHTGAGGAPIKTETTLKMDPNEAYRQMLGGK